MTLDDGVYDGVAVCDSVRLRVTVVDREIVRVCVAAAVPLLVNVLEAEADDDGVSDCDADAEVDDDKLPVLDGVRAAVVNGVGVLEYDGATVGVTVSTPAHGPPRHNVQSPASSTAQQLR